MKRRRPLLTTALVLAGIITITVLICVLLAQILFVAWLDRLLRLTVLGLIFAAFIAIAFFIGFLPKLPDWLKIIAILLDLALMIPVLLYAWLAVAFTAAASGEHFDYAGKHYEAARTGFPDLDTFVIYEHTSWFTRREVYSGSGTWVPDGFDPELLEAARATEGLSPLPTATPTPRPAPAAEPAPKPSPSPGPTILSEDQIVGPIADSDLVIVLLDAAGPRYQYAVARQDEETGNWIQISIHPETAEFVAGYRLEDGRLTTRFRDASGTEYVWVSGTDGQDWVRMPETAITDSALGNP